jgi:hypothetical protein
MANQGITLTASANTEAIARALGKTANEQIPFATANALTAIAERVRAGQRDVMRQRLDRPTAFTLNSLYLKAARKNNLEARVWFKDYAAKGTPAAKYLSPEVYGGARGAKRFEKALIARGIMGDGQFAIPAGGAPLDQYGNVPRGLYVKILSGLKAFGQQGYDANATNSTRSRRKGNAQRYFVAEIDGTAGIWERVKSGFGDGVKPLFVFTDSAPKYRIRIPFFKIAENIHKANYEREFKYALEQAIKTAR